MSKGHGNGHGAASKPIGTALPGTTLVANMVETGKTPLLTPGELADLGFTLIVSPLTALFAATKALRDSLAVLCREGSLRDHLDQLVDFDDFTRVVDLDGHAALDARYRA